MRSGTFTDDVVQSHLNSRKNNQNKLIRSLDRFCIRLITFNNEIMKGFNLIKIFKTVQESFRENKQYSVYKNISISVNIT